MSRFSRLAILTQLGLTCYLVLIVVLAYRVGQAMSASWGVAALSLVFAMPMTVIGVGVFLPFLLNHRREAAAGWRDAFRAWRSEMGAVIRAGLWWQPFRWWQYSNWTSRNVSPSNAQLPPCILLHGFVSNRGLWNPWLCKLESRGVPFVCINLEPLFGSINDYVQAIENAVSDLEQFSSTKPIVICHSMGGLALRKWLVSQASARQRIDKIVTIGTPHRGTWLGRFSMSINGREMGLGSEWLAELEAEEKKARPVDTYAGFTCWYSNCDNIVIPAESAKLPGANNRKIRGYGHLALAYHPQIMELDDICNAFR